MSDPIKIKSLEELRRVFQEDPNMEDEALILDNDSTDLFSEKYVYHGGSPEELLREALDLLGIPWTGA